MWRRVVTPVALLILLWVGTGLTTTFLISALYRSQTVPYAQNVTTIEAVARLEAVLWQMLLALNETPSQSRFADLEVAFEKHLNTARPTCSTPEEQRLIAAIDDGYREFRNVVNHRKRSEAGRGENCPEVVRSMRRVLEPCIALANLNERQLEESAAWSAELNKYIVLIRAVFFVSGPLVGVVSGYLVARGVHRSMSQISVTLKDAASNLEHEVGWVELGPSGDLPAIHQQLVAISRRIKQVMDELHEARRGVLQATRLAAVGELAAGLAHELRNPLTSVKLLVQTAGRCGHRTLTEQQYQVVQDEIVRMESIIQGLLDFARPPAPHRLRHDLRETVERAVSLVSGRARQQNIEIRLDLPGDPLTVDADVEQLHQVFVNVLLNGLESMDQSGTLSVAARRDHDHSATCRVVFCDTGPGISGQVLERLFEPFTTTKEHGTGLGLAISRRIVEEHGGTMSAANGKEGGAVITVELPAC